MSDDDEDLVVLSDSDVSEDNSDDKRATKRKASYRNCCVLGCRNTTNNTQHTFFTLPTDPQRREDWLKLIQREDLYGFVASHCSVCEVHFAPDAILYSPNRKVLKKNSYPTLRLPVPRRNSQATQTNVRLAESFTQCYVGRSEIGSQTPNYLFKNTPREQKLKLELFEVSKQLLECKKKLKADHSIKGETNTFFRLCDKFLRSSLAEIVKEQTRVRNQAAGNRYSREYKDFCYNLYNTSPQAYNLLKDTLCLPSKVTISRFFKSTNSEVKSQQMDILKTRVDNMSSEERNCSLIIDVMSIKHNLFYNIKEDKIYGFHEVDGVQTPEPAKSVLVAMLRGIFKEFEQPVAYALLGESITHEEISKWIDKLLRALLEIGLNIRVVIANMGPEFLSDSQYRSVSAETPYFFVDNRKIYYIFDPPHLMNMLRNKLLSFDFHFDGFVAKWSYICQFYERDRLRPVRVAPKLTENHIKPNNMDKRRIKYAVDVLSLPVASGMSMYKDFGAIDPFAEGTIRLIAKINDFYASLNSCSRQSPNKFKNAFIGSESQISFFNDMMYFFENLKLINPKNGTDVTSKAKFIEGFQVTIRAILFLFEELRVEGYNQIFTKRLNQDCLTKFFSKVKIRRGNSKTPTSWHLAWAFRNTFFAHYMKADDKRNADFSTNEITVKQEPGLETPASTKEFDTIMISMVDYETLEIPENNGLMYVSEYLFKKCMEKDEKIHQFYVDSGQFLPPQDFVQFVGAMDEKFCEYFDQEHLNRNILNSVLNEVKNFTFPSACENFPLAYVMKLFLRLRIYFTLKQTNKIFRQSRNRTKYFSVSRLK